MTEPGIFLVQVTGLTVMLLSSNTLLQMLSLMVSYTTITIWYNPCIIRQYSWKPKQLETMYYSHSYITAKFGILDDFCVITNIFTRSFSRIINPSLKLENPASCLCTIALFQCVRPAPLRILREMCVLENAKVVSVLRALSNLKHCKQWNITWPRLRRIYTGE